MKQLKFMLAAATAISLATAAQAAVADEELSNEKFNSYTEGQAVIGNDGAALIDGFSYTGTAGDNESTIIKESEGDMALKVNTGTDPLLRMIDTKNRQDVNLAATDFNYLNIDTMVQFTVTPETDTVLPGLTNPDLKDEDGNVVLEGNIKEDKLLIYLQEKTVGETKSNVLTVWASEVQSGGDDDFGTGVDKFVPTKVEIPGVEVVPNQWYRLQVKTYVENGIVLFSIKLGDTELASSVALYSSATQGTKAFPSLLGKATTLTYVGFAGEGTVDDLVVTKNYNVPDAVDFTFKVTWDTGISAVTYTISEDGTTSEAAQVPADGFSVPEGATVELAVTLKDSEWTKLADGTVLKFENVAADKEDINLTTVKIAQKVDSETGNVVVNPDASASDVGINSDSAFADADAEKLGEVLTWAKTASVTVDQINKMTFSEAGDPAGATDADKLVEEAYLLNCTTAEVENKKKSFKISADDLAKLLKDGALTQLDVDSNLYNGKVVIEGRNDLTVGTWEITEQGNSHKFYRARLVFPTK